MVQPQVGLKVQLFIKIYWLLTSISKRSVKVLAYCNALDCKRVFFFSFLFPLVACLEVRYFLVQSCPFSIVNLLEQFNF